MGQIAEDIIDGLICQLCGVLVDGSEVGYPRNCKDCEESQKR